MYTSMLEPKGKEKKKHSIIKLKLIHGGTPLTVHSLLGLPYKQLLLYDYYWENI